MSLAQFVGAFFTQPAADLQRNLTNLAAFRMILESHSLKTAFARFHLTTPQMLRELRTDREATSANAADRRARAGARGDPVARPRGLREPARPRVPRRARRRARELSDGQRLGGRSRGRRGRVALDQGHGDFAVYRARGGRKRDHSSFVNPRVTSRRSSEPARRSSSFRPSCFSLPPARSDRVPCWHPAGSARTTTSCRRRDVRRRRPRTASACTP